MNDAANENDAANYKVNNSMITTSKSFKYNTKITGKRSNFENRLDGQVVVPLKYLSSFWIYLDLPLINWEIVLHLLRSKDCVISQILRRDSVAGDSNANLIVQDSKAAETDNATFQMNSFKLYVSVVTLSINDNIKF